MTKLTIEELTHIIQGVIKEFKESTKKKSKKKDKDAEKPRKGISGYPVEDNEDVMPHGFSQAEVHDLSKKSEEGNRYKRQGASNMGPFTAESAIRAIASKAIKESFKIKKIPNKKVESSAPFNAAQAKVGKKGSVGNVNMPEWKTTSEGSVWEDLGRYYHVEGQRPKSASQTKFESNIMNNVYGSRFHESKKQKPTKKGFSQLHEKIKRKKS